MAARRRLPSRAPANEEWERRSRSGGSRLGEGAVPPGACQGWPAPAAVAAPTAPAVSRRVRERGGQSHATNTHEAHWNVQSLKSHSWWWIRSGAGDMVNQPLTKIEEAHSTCTAQCTKHMKGNTTLPK
jgi:hypothetical protein